LDKIIEIGSAIIGKMDLMLAKQNEALKRKAETTSDVRALRDNLELLIDERFKRIERDVELIMKRHITLDTLIVAKYYHI